MSEGAVLTFLNFFVAVELFWIVVDFHRSTLLISKLPKTLKRSYFAERKSLRRKRAFEKKNGQKITQKKLAKIEKIFNIRKIVVILLSYMKNDCRKIFGLYGTVQHFMINIFSNTKFV